MAAAVDCGGPEHQSVLAGRHSADGGVHWEVLRHCGGANVRLWALLIILVANSAIGLYYYLRAILVMYRRPAEEQAGPAASAAPHVAARVVVSVMTVLLLWFGLYPAPLIRLIQRLAAL